MSENNKENNTIGGVGIVAPTPGSDESESGHIATRMMVNVLLCYHPQISVFTRDTAVMEFNHEQIHLTKYHKPFGSSTIVPRLIGHLFYQIMYCIGIFRRRKNLEFVIFGGSGFVLPMLTSRLLGKDVLYRLGGVVYFESTDDRSLRSHLSRFLLFFIQHVTCSVSTAVVLMSPNILEFAELDRYTDKSYIWNHYYFDLDEFSPTIPYRDRDFILGQVGIVSETKGSMKFVKAVESLAVEIDGAMIIGDGPILDETIKYSEEHDLPITFTGRVPREEIPEYMNQMKFLVVNSKSEGLPKVALEAMACGTPVIATRVGGLPDYISNGKNGYLIDSNDPDELAAKINDCIQSGDLVDISKNARAFAVDNFSFESTISSYRELCDSALDLALQTPEGTPTEEIERP